jgi:hypothetical protein
MDAPNGELNAGRLQRFPPGKDMLLHAVHESAIEIEQKRWRG